MEHRYLKAVLLALVGLQALVWLGNNLINWQTAQGAVAYALSLEGQSGYGNHVVPAITRGAAATLVLSVILVGEAIAAACCLYGCFALWRARRAPAETFSRAKRYGVIGCGAGIIVWFGLFGVFGGGLLMMGQADGLSGALDGAFRFASYCFLTLIYLGVPEGGAKAT